MTNQPDQRNLGINFLAHQLTKAGLQIIEQARPWPDKRVTYLVLGTPNRQTDIVVSDTFLSDLPATTDYHLSLSSYAYAVAGRVRFGSPEVFFCRSGRIIRIEIQWPSETAIYDGYLQTWLRVDVFETEYGNVAKCGVKLERNAFGLEGTPFDEVKRLVNAIRRSVDAGSIEFFEPNKHPRQLQQLEIDSEVKIEPTATPEIESFLAGKAYFMGFKADGIPEQVWTVDPWDAEYLGVPTKNLSQAAFILQARDLVVIKEPADAITAAKKLMIEGWPTAVGAPSCSDQVVKVSLRLLPNKDKLVEDTHSALKRTAGCALLVIDLDHFKQVNDTKGHSEGDLCLERAVRSISEALGRKGSLYRWGGDEFAVILPDYSLEEAKATAERIRCAIAESGAGGEIAVTASIGVAATDGHDSVSAESFLDSADKAMYESKNRGKNRVTTWPLA
jgi:diguanylate cyclase (GGDEF)-like protein